MAHAEEIDPRLNRRKDTIIKLQTYIMDNAENEEFDSDEHDSRDSSEVSDDDSPPSKYKREMATITSKMNEKKKS